jgi:hypothetical protein
MNAMVYFLRHISHIFLIKFLVIFFLKARNRLLNRYGESILISSWCRTYIWSPPHHQTFTHKKSVWNVTPIATWTMIMVIQKQHLKKERHAITNFARSSHWKLDMRFWVSRKSLSIGFNKRMKRKRLHCRVHPTKVKPIIFYAQLEIKYSSISSPN